MENYSIQYLDQSAGDLYHRLILGEIDISQFQILKQAKIVADHLESRPFKFTSRIIGGSHFFTFDFKTHQFHEVLACIDVNVGKLAEEAVSYGPFQNISANIETKLYDEFGYSFQAQLLAYSSAATKLSVLENNARCDDNSQFIGMIYEFPHKTNGPASKTIVTADFLPSVLQLHIKTAHSYPQEKKVLLSTSILDLS